MPKIDLLLTSALSCHKQDSQISNESRMIIEMKDDSLKKKMIQLFHIEKCYFKWKNKKLSEFKNREGIGMSNFNSHQFIFIYLCPPPTMTSAWNSWHRCILHEDMKFMWKRLFGVKIILFNMKNDSYLKKLHHSGNTKRKNHLQLWESSQKHTFPKI